MKRVLQRLLGRLPIGWFQLTHSPMRFAAALIGVAFANVLVFVQLGIMTSMGTATLRPYAFFEADVMIFCRRWPTLTSRTEWDCSSPTRPGIESRLTSA